MPKLSAFIDAGDAYRKLRFAGDSPLERDGFEPSVPRRALPSFVLIGACPRFPILHNAKETNCPPYSAAQLRHSAYYSHPQRAMRHS
jgi:hypothetical protein